MYVMLPLGDTFLQYANRQSDNCPSAFALYPVTAANVAAKQRKEFSFAKLQRYSFSQRNKAVSKEAAESVLIELTGKGQFINERV